MNHQRASGESPNCESCATMLSNFRRIALSMWEKKN